MKHIKIITTAFFLMVMTSGVFAQNGTKSIGLRFGGTNGLTYKHYQANKAFEGILGFWGNGISLTALWEKQAQAFETDGFRWYYGLGGHVALFNTGNSNYGFGRGERSYNDNAIAFGVDAVIGLEYKIREIPFAISFGLKPFLEIDSDGRFYGAPDPGFGLKYFF